MMPFMDRDLKKEQRDGQKKKEIKGGTDINLGLELRIWMEN